jgi:hypothetical protein
LKNVLAKNFSDFYGTNDVPCSNLVLKQIGIQFEELDNNQSGQLDDFINDFKVDG